MKKFKNKNSATNASKDEILTEFSVKDFKKTIKRLLSCLAIYKWRMVIVLILGVLSSLFSVLGPKAMGGAINELFDGVTQAIRGESVNINIKYIGVILLVVFSLYLISAGFMYLQGIIMAGVTAKIGYGLRKEMSQKINKVQIGYYDTISNGEVLSRLTNDVDTMSSILSHVFTELITSVVTLLGIIIMMFVINWQFAIASILTVPISYIVIKIIAEASQKYFSKRQETLGNVTGYTEEIYSEHNIVQVFNAEERSIAEFGVKSNELCDVSWKAQFFSGVTLPIIEFIGNFGYIVVTVFGGILTIKRMITIGDIQAFIQYIRSLNQPITQMATISTTIQQVLASSERVFEFLDQDEEIQAEELTKLPDDIRGDVEFKHVSFGYKKDQEIIKDLSLKIRAGHKIAIVGPTGSGKTTIVKLLLRFYDITSGDIFIDGINTKNFARKDLRSLFSMVLQDAWMYSGSIRDNIKYSSENATDDEIRKAAKAAYVDHFINTLQDGYDTIVNEEATNISQGEKQLITIARAILSNSRILILDEATSSVDTRTENLIQKAMDNLMKNRTSFVIAHRLSTIKNADIILVMKDGKIIESGKHNQLLEEKGLYFEMYSSQFEI